MSTDNPAVMSAANADDEKMTETISTTKFAELSSILLQIKQIWSNIIDKLGQLIG